MRLSIEIDLDDDAMRVNSTRELERMFKRVIEWHKAVPQPVLTWKLADTNGNTVGRFVLTA